MKSFHKKSQTPQQRIIAAIAASDFSYVMKTMQTRTAERAGSYVPDTTAEELLEKIKHADWKPFSHPAIARGTTAFSAKISGVLGVMPVTSLPPEAEIILADPKHTGFYSAYVNETRVAENARVKADHSILILGPDDNGREVFYTFHPGDPVVPQGIATQNNPLKTMTAGALAAQYPQMSVKLTAPESYAQLTAKTADSTPKTP